MLENPKNSYVGSVSNSKTNSELNPAEKRLIHLQAQDWAFLVITVFLFSMVSIHALGLGFAILFYTQLSPGTTIFSYLSFTFTFLGGTLWGATTFIRRHSKEKGKELEKQFLISMFRFVGIRKIGLKGSLLIILAFGIGVFFNAISTLAISCFAKGSVSIGGTAALTPYNIATFLIGNPILEELMYRAFFIGFFLQTFGKNRVVAAIALIVSSFIFGFTHYGPTWYLLVKTAGGIMLGSIYLTGWGKNYLSSLGAHIGFNVVGILTVVST
jgi:membrane protease YdiL (CAAX protease family)